MKALTIRQPWAWAIIYGGKDVENRSRNLAGSYRGPVAIHAGLAPFEQHNMASRALRSAHGSEVSTEILFGAIIGIVDLVDVHAATPDDLGRIRCETTELGDPWDMACSLWAMETAYHLVLRNPRPLATPIPYRGRLGLWEVPADTWGAS